MSRNETVPKALDAAAVARGRKTVIAVAIVAAANAIPELAGSYSTHGLSWSLLSTRALAAICVARVLFKGTPSMRFWDAGFVAIMGLAFLVGAGAESSGGMVLVRNVLAWSTIVGAVVIAASPDVAEYGKTNVRPPDDGALLSLDIEKDKGVKVP